MLAFKPEWFVALLGAYVVYTVFHGVLNRMSRGVPQPLRCAIAILILPGALGKAFGAFMDTPEVYVDLLLVGGIALLFTVDRRHVEAEPDRRKLFARTAAVVVFVLGGLACSAAQAQGSGDGPRVVRVVSMADCVAFGNWVQGAADMRDAGASLELQLPIVRKRNAEQPPATVALLVRETRRVYAELHCDAEALGAEAFERCAFGLIGK